MAVSTQRPRAASGDRPRTASGEFKLLAKVRAAVEKLGRGRGVVVGIGDDCAVVELPRPRRGHPTPRLVLTTDTMIEGVHFRAGWLTPRELGVRAFRAAVSDIAAMGAEPRHVLLSLEIPGETNGFGERDALALVRAVAIAARQSGAALVGGNVSGSARLGVTVTVVGEAGAKPLLRSGARAGDLVFVTGRLGGAAAGLRALLACDAKSPRSASATREARRAAATYRRPPLRLDFAAALSRRGLVHAAIDVSDGLLQDLGHLAAASRVAIRIDSSRVPVHRAALRELARPARKAAATRESAVVPLSFPLQLALTGGEDYEVAFTAPARNRTAIEKIAAAQHTPVCVIGVVEKGRPRVRDLAGRPIVVNEPGFDHLRLKDGKKTVRPRRARRVVNR